MATEITSENGLTLGTHPLSLRLSDLAITPGGSTIIYATLQKPLIFWPAIPGKLPH